jgi:hypothetical protein
MPPPRRFPCSWVTAPSPNKLGVWSGKEGPPQAAIHARGHSIVTTRGANGRGPSLFQPPGSTALLVGDYHVDVSGARCLDCSFSEELGDVEINTRIHKVPAYGADLNHGAAPAMPYHGCWSALALAFDRGSAALQNA